MDIKEYAEREMKRMQEVMKKVKIVSNDKNAREFYDFATNYYKDGLFFHKNKEYEDAFEAFIIAWAYVDISMKLKFLEVPKDILKYFTVDH